MTARDELFGFVEVGAEEEDLPTFAAAIEAFRAEVLADAGKTLIELGYEAAGQLLRDTADVVRAPAPRCDVTFVDGGQCTKAAGHWTPKTQDPHTPTAPTPPVPDNTTAASTTVACTCLGGPTLRDGQVLHSGYCDTVVHAPWTPQREAAIRATAKEGAGSLHSALGATVPNEDVLAVFLQLDEARKELARRTPTGDEGELARLRTFAQATAQRHQDIRDHLAQVDIRQSAEAWDLGMAVLALLEGPLPRNAEGGER